jgi:hypothetical protein
LALNSQQHRLQIKLFPSVAVYLSRYNLWAIMPAWGRNGLVSFIGAGAGGRLLPVASPEKHRTRKGCHRTAGSDNRLYQHIKAGMREYHWRNQKQEFLGTRSGELLFETAHQKAFSSSRLIRGRSSVPDADSRIVRISAWCKMVAETGARGSNPGSSPGFGKSEERRCAVGQTSGLLPTSRHRYPAKPMRYQA